MSEFLAAAAEMLNVPEAIVQRSAEARAAVSGSTAESVLQAWAGGNAPTPAAQPVAEIAAEPPTPVEHVPDAAAEPAPAAVVEPTAGESPERAAPVAVAEAEPPGPATVEDARFDVPPLSERIRLPAVLGAIAGATFGMMTAVVASVFLFDGAGVLPRGEDFRASVEAGSRPVVIGLAVLSALFGVLLGRLGRSGPSWFRPDLAVQKLGGGVLGGLLGLLFGAAGGGALMGMLGEETLTEGVVAVPVLPAVLLLIAGGAIFGSVVAIAGQLSAMPAGLSTDELESSELVRKRLASSMLVPVTALITIVAIVAAFALVLINFHAMAAPLAIIVAAGILAFAFLSGNRPNVRIGPAEILVAATGIIVVVVVIAAVVLAQGGH